MSEIFSADNTKELNAVLNTTLVLWEFADRFGLTLSDDIPNAKYTRWKQYGWRVDIPFSFWWEQGTMVTLWFNSWDGTGDGNTFPEWTLIIPKKYQFDSNPTRVHPRAKTINTPKWAESLPVEVMIPLGILNKVDLVLHRNATELVELWVNWNRVVPIWNMNRYYYQPQMLFTVHGEWEKREWDPHAIFAPKNTEWNIQIAAFIAANDINSQIGQLLKMHGLRIIP